MRNRFGGAVLVHKKRECRPKGVTNRANSCRTTAERQNNVWKESGLTRLGGSLGRGARPSRTNGLCAQSGKLSNEQRLIAPDAPGRRLNQRRVVGNGFEVGDNCNPIASPQSREFRGFRWLSYWDGITAKLSRVQPLSA